MLKHVAKSPAATVDRLVWLYPPTRLDAVGKPVFKCLIASVCCRLLRNRVSAQQARERKKSYVATLEEKCKAQGQRLEEAEQRIKTLERENVMLRSVMKNMQVGSAQMPAFCITRCIHIHRSACVP